MRVLLCDSAGICHGESVLPPGPVDAILGKNVTLKVLKKTEATDDIVWNYSDGTNLNIVARLKAGKVLVADLYKGRASLNATNGFLTLTGLTVKDSGDYSISILGDEQAAAGEVKLRVLRESF